MFISIINVESEFMGKEELEWLSKHQKEVEKYSGKWIALKAKRGIIASGETASEVMEIAKKKYKIDSPLFS